jgi:hypothetical protein
MVSNDPYILLAEDDPDDQEMIKKRYRPSKRLHRFSVRE